MRISPGALSTFIGISGTGLGMALPGLPLIGWGLILLALVIFAFQVKYENGGVRANWPWQVKGVKMIPVTGMIISILSFVIFGIW